MVTDSSAKLILSEQDYSSYVPGAGPTRLGLVGTASRGPLNTPTLITNEAQLINTFGEPKASPRTYGILTAIQYLRRGTSLYYQRIHRLPVNASVVLRNALGANDLRVVAVTAGTAGNNLRVTVGDSSYAGGYMLTVALSGVTVETWDNLTNSDTPGPGLMDAELAINGFSSYIVVFILDTADPAHGASNLTGGLDGAVAADVTLLGGAIDSLEVTASSAGTWANDDLGVMIKNATQGTSGYKLEVYFKSELAEVFDNLTNAGTIPTGFYNPETAVNGVSSYITVAKASTTNPNKSTTIVHLLTGGTDGDATLSAADFIGEADDKSGLYAFYDPSDYSIDLLACPGSFETLDDGVTDNDAVIAMLLAVVEHRGDCLALVDSPYGLSLEEVVDWHNGKTVPGVRVVDTASLNTSYGALCWPWVQVYDPYNATYVWIPSSGHEAAACAYTDSNWAPWLAPAGYTRGVCIGVTGLEHNSTEGERDYLYGGGNAVNPIVNFPTQGVVIWGQRTLLRSTSILSRINVRRCVNYIKQVVRTVVSGFFFEPNDPTLWDRFVATLSPYLDDVKARRGLYDYRVICDSTLNTDAVIARGEMRGRVILRPTIAVEVITVEFSLVSTAAAME